MHIHDDITYYNIFLLTGVLSEMESVGRKRVREIITT